MLLHCGRAGILPLCTKVARTATASPQDCPTDFLWDKTAPHLCYRGLYLREKQLWLLLMWTNCVDVISEKCISGNVRLIVPQCLQRGFCHAATTEVALPFSSPCLPIRGSVRSPQHCPESPSQLSYHLSVTPGTKRDCRWALIKTCINFTSRRIS